MAAPNGMLAPIQIEYPHNVPKRDQPTSGLPNVSAPTQAVQQVLSNIIHSSDQTIGHRKPCRIGQRDQQTCYRDAILTALLHMKPFVEYLRSVTSPNQTIDNSNVAYSTLSLLRRISDTYWSGADQTRYIDLRASVDTWYQALKTTSTTATQLTWVQSRGANQTAPPQADAIEFMSYFLNRARDSELAGNDQQILDRLLRCRFAERRAYECSCNEKRRQTADYDDQNAHNDFHIAVNATANQQPLSSLLSSWTFDDNDAYRGTCNTCGLQNLRYYRFAKFQYLPEVLTISITHQDPNAVVDMPSMLDLSLLQDDCPQGPDQRRDTPQANYRLNAVITYQAGQAFGRSGHYYCIVRRHDGTWTVVDEMSNPVVQENLPQLTLQRGFVPRALFYVRDRSLDNDGPNTAAAAAVGYIQQNDQDQLQTQPIATLQQAAIQATQQVPSPVNHQNTAQAAQPTPSTTSDTGADATRWDAIRLRRELLNRNIGIGNMRAKDKLLARWNDFHNADYTGRLGFMVKSELLSRIASANISGDFTNSNKPALIQALVDHRAAQVARAVQASRTTQPSQPSAPAAPTTISSSQDLTVQITTLTSQVTTLSQEVARLTALNNSLIQSPAQSTGPANQTLLAQNQSLTAGNARLSAENTRLSALNNTLVQQNRDLQARLYDLTSTARSPPSVRDSSTQTGTNIVPSAAQTSPTPQGVATPTQSLLTPTQPPSSATQTNLSAVSPASSSQGSTEIRVMRVTTTGVIDNLADDNHWDDDHKYILIPHYNRDRQLTTRQWWIKQYYLPDGGLTSIDKEYRYDIYFSVQGQDGSNAALYTWSIVTGPTIPPNGDPKIVVELLSQEDQVGLGHKINEGITKLRPPVAPAATARASPATPPAGRGETSGTQAPAPALTHGQGQEHEETQPDSHAAPQDAKRPAEDEQEDDRDPKRPRHDGQAHINNVNDYDELDAELFGDDGGDDYINGQ